VLSNIFGNLTSGLIRLAVTAATIILVYLFILKPILDTTENVSSGFTGNTDVQQVMDSVNEAFANEGSKSIQKQIETQLNRINSGDAAASSRKSQRLLRCVQRSAGDVARMQRCAERFAP
jgi:uncharacterized membrane protein YhiD involved in acid resistance